jgi:FlaA1/EpsC-like NDP-sugar epimerase
VTSLFRKTDPVIKNINPLNPGSMINVLQRFIIDRYSSRILSKWIVLLHDMSIVMLTFGLALLLRFNFNVSSIRPDHFVTQWLISGGVYLICFLFFSSFSGIIRHTGVEDVKKLLQSSFSAMAAMLVISIILRYTNQPGGYATSLSVIIIHFLLNVGFLTGSRFLIKLFYHTAVKKGTEFQKVVIFGAGYSGLMTKNSIESDTTFNYKVTAFLDDDPQKAGKFLHGIPVFQPEHGFSDYMKKNKIAELIIAIPNLTPSRKSQVIELCLNNNIKVKSVPPITNWINGELSASQIRQVSIEDLLNRAPIRIERSAAAKEIYEKVVMITGAAGSIGSEIVRQVINLNPSKLILIDQAESPMHDLELEINTLNRRFKVDVQFVICDVANLPKLTRLFEFYRPQIVYHAAAYKHVPMMERNPGEAVHVNIFGTKHLVDLAIVYEVEKFVFISTDKAVNPTNIMGATKRAAEIYVQNQAHYKQSKTAFITTRFGNVLGSNGSVIPLFMKQIEQGGPVTVTSKDVTRFFMTIPEACQLVLEAGAMGHGGEIFLFDMGKRVRIYDLAVKMIRLAGREPEKDILIEEIGLRPGEKLHEELLNAAEDHLPTHHPKIMVGRTREFDSDWVHYCVEKLRIAYADNNTIKLVLALKEMVPEFKSMNSDFQRLDRATSTEVAATA